MSLAEQLRDRCIGIMGSSDELSERVKGLRGSVPPTDPLWDRLAAVQRDVASLRHEALQAHVVTAAMLSPVTVPEEGRIAVRVCGLGLDRKSLAAGERPDTDHEEGSA